MVRKGAAAAAGKRSLRTAGFTAFEGIIGLMFLCSLLVLGARQINQQIDRQTEQAVAEQLVEVARCVRRYVADNYGWLLSKIEPLEEQVIHIKDVLKKGYLDSSFPGIDRKHELKNLFGQKYIVHLKLNNFSQEQWQNGDRQDNEIKDRRQLQILLLTRGGEPIQGGSLLRIIRAAGASAGWIKRFSLDELRALGKLPAPGQPLLPVDKIIGLQHSWELDMPKLDTTDPQNPKKIDITTMGHLAHLSYLSSSDILNSNAMLHRRQVPGDRGLKMNSMETDLEMRDCDILFSSKEISHEAASSSNNKERWVAKAKLSAEYVAWFKDGAKKDEKGRVDSSSFLGLEEVGNSEQKELVPILFLNNGHYSMKATPEGLRFALESATARRGQEAKAASGSDLAQRVSSGDMQLLATGMSRAWHKLAYHELFLPQSGSSKDGKRADSQQIISALDKYATERCRGTNKEHPVGRMFLMGAEHRAEVALYICGSETQKSISAAEADRAGVDREVQTKAIRLALLGGDCSGAVGK